MTEPISPEAYLDSILRSPAPSGAARIAQALADRYPTSALLLYGSGISLSAAEDPTEVLYDFYVIVPDYRAAFPNFLERCAARLLPPNVYYFELPTPVGVLRSKYAVLSVDAFARLVGPGTFHSYFWARFAQPSRLVACPDAMKSQIIAGVNRSIETFLRRAQGLVDDPTDWRRIWLDGLNASYRAELRAEPENRAERLIDSYGDWPETVARFALAPASRKTRGAVAAWRLRAALGAVLSAARLLKATATFRGGIDYIAWKVKRHAGVDVAVRPWERRHPFIAAPIVAMRYYRLRSPAPDDPPKGR